jgi:hypothetical protein
MKLSRLTLLALAPACGDGGGTPPPDPDAPVVVGDFNVDGTTMPVGGGTPASVTAMVLWVADNGSGDYAFKHGAGTATETTFHVAVDEPIPPDATFANVLGVGQVVLLPSSFVLADGVVADDNAVFDAMLGFAGEYAIIFKGPGSGPQPPSWLDAFPAGLSCGVCMPQASGFDTFVPIACSMMKIQVGPRASIAVCNWT